MAHSIVTNPKVGDILCLDENNLKKYIALDTYDSLPAGWTAVGVVAVRQGNKVIVVNKANAGQKWSDVMRWEVTGAALTDNVSHTQNFVANGVTLSLTWQTADNASFAAAINSQLSGYDFGGHNYRCVYDSVADKVYIFHDTFATWKEPTFAGVTLTRAIGETLVANSTAYRKSQRSIYWGVVNLKRGIEYYSTNGRTPTADEPVRISTGDSPVKAVEFKTNAYCAAIRAAYCVDPTNPTDEDYANYIYNEFYIEFPSARASMSEPFRNGKANTYALVGKKYLASDNTQKNLYPAAEYCAAVSYNCDGLRAGDWYLPSKHEMAKIWSQITYGLSGVTRATADAINSSLYAIGGSAISCTSFAWSSALYNSYIAWYYNSNGAFDGNYFCYGFTAVPCVLLDLSE